MLPPRSSLIALSMASPSPSRSDLARIFDAIASFREKPRGAFGRRVPFAHETPRVHRDDAIEGRLQDRVVQPVGLSYRRLAGAWRLGLLNRFLLPSRPLS